MGLAINGQKASNPRNGMMGMPVGNSALHRFAEGWQPRQREVYLEEFKSKVCGVRASQACSRDEKRCMGTKNATVE
eukprot:6025947-Amphidinium_carterae.1